MSATNHAVRSTPIRAFQWDLARQVERLDFLEQLLPRYAEWGYEELYLHLEDAVHFPSLPGLGRDDAYGYQELGELVLTAAKAGIRVVPIVNLLGHTQYLIKHAGLRDLNELRDASDQPLDRGQICPLHPRLPEVADKLLRDIAPYCTAGKVHVGLDESFQLGRCPRCREEISRIGLGGHFAGHVRRLHAQCARHDLKMGMWADMLYFVPEAIPQLPSGITAYDWYYYPFGKHPRVELFNFAERDLAPALKRQGIAYYGCPMNGAFRHEPLPVFGERLGNIRSWWRRCAATEAAGFLVTSWEANRLALETTTIVDAAAAGLWLNPEIDDATALLATGLERLFRTKDSRAIARSLLAADEFAFAGYARWQINDRWDVFAGGESTKPYLVEKRFFARLSATSANWPKALAASIAFRSYLADRDVFVRESARSVFSLRRLFVAGKTAEMIRLVSKTENKLKELISGLRTGRHAAHAMWKRTRKPDTTAPNSILLAADLRRLKELHQWLKNAARHPASIMGATPLCGIWQLQFMVHNFAPAAQKVIVEQRDVEGAWHELASRYTIEFRAVSARPSSRGKREFAVPLTSPDAPLRIRVRGAGQVAVSHISLTNGVEVRRAPDWRRKEVLGNPCAREGFPDLENPSTPLTVRCETRRE